MNELTREQELALIEALGNGGEFTRTDIKEPIGWARGLVWCDVAIGGCELTPDGARLATALKDRDAARSQCDHLHAKYAATQGAAGLAGNVSVDRNRELISIKSRLKEIQRAMHSAGYKSAAAMLNPIFRGESK